MPNHVTNKIKLIGDQARIDALLDAVKYDDGERGTLDFNKLIPMPSQLNMTAGSEEMHSINAFLSAANPENEAFPCDQKMSREDFAGLLQRMNGARMFGQYDVTLSSNDVQEKYLKYSDNSVADYVEMGAKYVSNFIKYGTTSWYSWSIMAWGTKWNSYDSEPLSDNTLTFQTAWSRVTPIVSKLAELYPDIDIEYQWADEDIGNNVGRADFSGGELVEEYFPEPQSKEAFELAAEIMDVELSSHDSMKKNRA